MPRYIDADRLIKKFYQWKSKSEKKDFKHGIKTAILLTEWMPTADVIEQKRGRWKINDNGTYSCSLCQSWIPSEQRYYAKYCLHCGAKMGEEK